MTHPIRLATVTVRRDVPSPTGRYPGHTPDDLLPVRRLLLRLAAVFFLLCAVIAILWLDRNGLHDHSDGVYFSMVTLTTVGYGDIVPVTTRTRLIDALVMTPVRIAVWFLFSGTAYQLIIRRYIEDYHTATLKASLDGDVIICGFGSTGAAAVKELLAKGTEYQRSPSRRADHSA